MRKRKNNCWIYKKGSDKKSELFCCSGHFDGVEAVAVEALEVDAETAVVCVGIADGAAVVGGIVPSAEEKGAVVTGTVRETGGNEDVAVPLKLAAGRVADSGFDPVGAVCPVSGGIHQVIFSADLLDVGCFHVALGGHLAHDALDRGLFHGQKAVHRLV